jgi:hypothetical protein
MFPAIYTRSETDEVIPLDFLRVSLLWCNDFRIKNLGEDLSDLLGIIVMVRINNQQALQAAFPTCLAL